MAALCAGDFAKFQRFGVFSVRRKGERPARIPATTETAPVSARRVVRFQPSRILIDRVQGRDDARGSSKGRR